MFVCVWAFMCGVCVCVVRIVLGVCACVYVFVLFMCDTFLQVIVCAFLCVCMYKLLWVKV